MATNDKGDPFVEQARDGIETARQIFTAEPPESAPPAPTPTPDPPPQTDAERLQQISRLANADAERRQHQQEEERAQLQQISRLANADAERRQQQQIQERAQLEQISRLANEDALRRQRAPQEQAEREQKADDEEKQGCVKAFGIPVAIAAIVLGLIVAIAGFIDSPSKPTVARSDSSSSASSASDSTTDSNASSAAADSSTAAGGASPFAATYSGTFSGLNPPDQFCPAGEAIASSATVTGQSGSQDIVFTVEGHSKDGSVTASGVHATVQADGSFQGTSSEGIQVTGQFTLDSNGNATAVSGRLTHPQCNATFEETRTG